MMSDVKITALGLAALKISSPEITIYIDAFITDHPMIPFDGSDADLIIVTHDHGDHFSAEAVANAALKSNAIIIGPPSIAYPLIAEYNVPAERLRILYHQDPNTPDTVRINDVLVRSYASRHFNEDDNMTIHNSYLLEIGNKKIYIAGDSYEIANKNNQLAGLDALVYNYIVFSRDASRVPDMEKVIKSLSPRHFIVGHIVDCDWTIRPDDLKKALKERKLDDVTVLDKVGSELVI